MSSKFVIPLLVVVAVAIGAVVWTFSDSGSSTDSHTDANPISKNGVAPNVDPTKQAPKPIDKVPLGGDDKGSGVTRDVVKSSESFDPSGVLTVDRKSVV